MYTVSVFAKLYLKRCFALQIIAPLLSVLARMHKETIIHRYRLYQLGAAES